MLQKLQSETSFYYYILLYDKNSVQALYGQRQLLVSPAKILAQFDEKNDLKSFIHNCDEISVPTAT